MKLYAAALVATKDTPDVHTVSWQPAAILAENEAEALGRALMNCKERYPEAGWTHKADVLEIPDWMIDARIE